MVKQGKYRATVALVCFLFVLLALNGCGRNQNVPNKQASGAGQEQTAPAPQAQPLLPPPPFSLQQPARWAGKVQMQILNDTAATALVPFASRVVEYLYQPSDKALVAQPLMLVIAMPQAGWEQTKAMPGPKLGKELGQRDGYVYILSLAKVSPYPKDSQDARAFSDLMVDAAGVSKSFTLSAK